MKQIIDTYVQCAYIRMHKIVPDFYLFYFIYLCSNYLLLNILLIFIWFNLKKNEKRSHLTRDSVAFEYGRILRKLKLYSS